MLAREVQGERRAEPARAMLSRSLHSYSQILVCGYKITSRFSDWGTLKNPIIIGFKKTSETSINKGKKFFA